MDGSYKASHAVQIVHMPPLGKIISGVSSKGHFIFHCSTSPRVKPCSIRASFTGVQTVYCCKSGKSTNKLNTSALPNLIVASMSAKAADGGQGSFLTPTSGSGLKHRIRELECIIESELKALQRQVQQFKCQKIVQTGRTEEVVQEAKEEMLAALQQSKNELKQFFVQQRMENQRLHEMIRALRNENFALQQSQLALQRRLQTAEVDLGQ